MNKLLLLICVALLFTSCANTDLPPEPNAPGAAGNYFKYIDTWSIAPLGIDIDNSNPIECSPGEIVHFSVSSTGRDRTWDIFYIWDDQFQEWGKYDFDKDPIYGSTNWIDGDGYFSVGVYCEELYNLAEDGEIYVAGHTADKLPDGTWDNNPNEWEVDIIQISMELQTCTRENQNVFLTGDRYTWTEAAGEVQFVETAVTYSLDLNDSFLYNSGNMSYGVSIVGGDSDRLGNSIILDVNGVRKTVLEGVSVNINGLQVYVQDIFVTNIPTLSVSAELNFNNEITAYALVTNDGYSARGMHLFEDNIYNSANVEFSVYEFNYYGPNASKNNVIVSTDRVYDHCSGSTLVKFNCAGNIYQGEITECQNGCANAACITAIELPDDPTGPGAIVDMPDVVFDNADYDVATTPASDVLRLDVTNVGDSVLNLGDYDIVFTGNGESINIGNLSYLRRSLAQITLNPGDSTEIKFRGSGTAPIFSDSQCGEVINIGLVPVSLSYENAQTNVVSNLQGLVLNCNFKSMLLDVATGVSNSGYPTQVGNLWQSFTSVQGGSLASIELKAKGNYYKSGIKVYEGEGVSGKLLYEQASADSIKEIEESSFLNYRGDLMYSTYWHIYMVKDVIELTPGSVYTIQTPDTFAWRIHSKPESTEDLYSGGRSNYGGAHASNADLGMEVYVYS